MTILNQSTDKYVYFKCVKFYRSTT